MLTSHEPATVIITIFARRVLSCKHMCDTVDVVQERVRAQQELKSLFTTKSRRDPLPQRNLPLPRVHMRRLAILCFLR